jgi:hypothetical protein
MEQKTLNGNGKMLVEVVETPRGIVVPHKNELLTFSYPMIGPGYFKNIMSEVDKIEKRPTTAQTLSLVDLALQNPDDKYCQELLKRFRNQYFWTGTQSTSFSEGVIVYDNVDGKMPSSSGDLVKLHLVEDPRVRFVKKGFKVGSMPIAEFLKHPYLIAQIGEDMVPIAERVAQKLHKTDAYVFGIESASKDVNRYTALNSYCNDGRLFLNGNCDDDYDDGCASGVLVSEPRSGEAAQKK